MAKHRIRRWFQFGIFDLLLLTTIAAVGAVLWRQPRIETYYEPLTEGMTAGQHWAGNGLRMKFRWCPAGEFKMGEPPNQVDVTISRGFWMGKYEVTQDEYRQMMDENLSYFSHEGLGKTRLPADVDTDKLPAEHLFWKHAVEFCRRFTEQERRAGRLPPEWEYRLPNEAQWEYACRAGTQTTFSFGDDQARLADFAWCRTNAGRRTHEVGQKPANAWGLHDMHGNVSEWCDNSYWEGVRGGAADASRQTSAHVARGGSWNLYDSDCRSAAGFTTTIPNLWDPDRGFRVALVQSPARTSK